MTDETMRRFGSARTIAATPLAVAILALTCAMPAEAGWIQNHVQKVGKSLTQNKVKSSVNPNPNAVGTLTYRLVGIFNNASGGDGDMDAVNESMGQFIREAVPVLKPVLNLGEAVINAPENLKDMLKSAKRKIGSVVGRTVDPRGRARGRQGRTALVRIQRRPREGAVSGGGGLRRPYRTGPPGESGPLGSRPRCGRRERERLGPRGRHGNRLERVRRRLVGVGPFGRTVRRR